MSPSVSIIVTEHSSFVWRTLIHLGVRESLVPDLCQEVFLIAMRRQGEFEGRSSTRTWLYGICRNLATDSRRREARRHEVTMDELPESVVMPAQEGALWAKRAHALLVKALETLDEEPRRVFILFEIEQLTMDEIATATSTPLRTCYARLEVARERIRALLKRSEQVSVTPRKESSP